MQNKCGNISGTDKILLPPVKTIVMLFCEIWRKRYDEWLAILESTVL